MVGYAEGETHEKRALGWGVKFLTPKYRCVAVKTLPLGTDVEIECIALLPSSDSEK